MNNLDLAKDLKDNGGFLYSETLESPYYDYVDVTGLYLSTLITFE